MPPLLILMMFNVVFNAFAAALQVFFVSTGEGAWHLIFLCLHSFFFVVTYPAFLREWKAWWNE